MPTQELSLGHVRFTRLVDGRVAGIATTVAVRHRARTPGRTSSFARPSLPHGPDRPPRFIRGFAKDAHISNLLLFPPETQFSSDPLYHEGKIILQDKASCFPAFILAPPSRDGTVVIDATAAPGNKTSHLCALMNNKGKVSGVLGSLFGVYMMA